MTNTVICSFIKKCKNYPEECQHCKWNSACEVGDYLEMETKEGKTVKYLVS